MDKVDQLISILEQIELLLSAHGEQHWSNWIRKDIETIKNQDAYGIFHFLSAYGGMGSFNDIWLCTENGHKIIDSEVNDINNKLSTMKSMAYIIANDIKREIQ